MAETFDYQAQKPQFDIGRVINRTFRAVKNNFVSFFLASLIIMGLPMFLLGIWPIFMGSGGMMDGDTVNPDYMTGIFVVSGLTGIVTIIGSVILQGALIFGAIADFNGRKAPFRECMSVALRFFFPLLGLGILVGLGILLGFLLLIVPGIFLMLGWAIAAPALIVEGNSVTDSISRSWELTQGYKRWILLLFLIFLVISALVSGILGVFTLMAGDPTTVMLEGGSNLYHFLNAVFSALSQAITTMISATGVAAIYYEIRHLKEGIGAENLAAIFE